MTEPSRIVVLNGPPRSGKTSIARAMQEGVEGVWVNLGVDGSRQVTPPALQPGIGLRPGGERPDLEPFLPGLYHALYDSVAAYAARGFDVVVDVGHHDAYSRPLGILAAVAPRLAELDALFVGVHCPIDVVMARRDATGWARHPPFVPGTEVPEAVARWQAAVHDPGVYDLEVDTSHLTPAAAAEAVAARLADEPPTAFRRLAGGDPPPA